MMESKMIIAILALLFIAGQGIHLNFSRNRGKKRARIFFGLSMSLRMEMPILQGRQLFIVDQEYKKKNIKGPRS